MNRSASRFLSSMPISNGSFAKPSIESDAKPLPPLILDRFRAMVKEREEELRVFGGEVAADEIVRVYEIALSSLTFNSKPIITDLTIIAGEQRPHGEGIADAICARIIEAPVDQKLPSLYLLDSIVKNIGKEYIRYFSVHLPEVFCEAYAQVHPSMRPAMRHLFGTWSAVFPVPVLRKIEARLQFSPSGHGQSSSLSTLRASESPRPTHGIHVNPKYLETRHQVGVEGVSSTSRASLTTSGLDAVKKSLASAARITKPASPYRIGHGSSLSPSLEDFSVDDSPRGPAVSASPSHMGIKNYGLSKVMDKEEEPIERQARSWMGSSNQHLKSPSAYNYTNSADLQGPRALINAYGIDEREKNLKRKHQTPEQLNSNGVNQKLAVKTWQNTEEEEFDWQDMAPTSSDQRQFNEPHSSIPLPGNLTARDRYTANHAAPLVTDYRSNRPKARFSSVSNSSIVEDVPHIDSVHVSVNKVTGVLPNVAGPTNSVSQIPSNFSRGSTFLRPQQSPSRLNAEAGGSFPESKSFLTAGERKPPIIGNFPNADGMLGRPSNPLSMSNTTYNSPAPGIPSTDATNAWHPSKLPSSHYFPSVYTPQQTPFRGQYGNFTFDQGPNKTYHSEQHLGSSRIMSQVNMARNSNQRPGPAPLNLQSLAQPSQVQPNMLMPQEGRQNIPLPSGASAPLHAMVPPSAYGYLPPAYGTRIGTTSGVQPPFTNINAPNMPFQIPGPALPSLNQGPLHGTTQALHVGNNIGQVAANPPAGGALSGLISSLVAQGLLSVTNKDSVGVDFDQDSLKVRHESAITALYADLPRQCKTCGHRFKSQEEHSKHMDWHVNRNRTLKNRKTKPSPKWFVGINMWLSGAEALGTDSAPGFLPAEDIVEKKEDEEMAVPADEDQNACALCGEPFEDFYSDETEEWMYKGAVYMYVPAGGLTVGMDRSQLGPIIHAKCRSDSHGTPSGDFTKDEGESTETGEQRKRLRS